MSKFIVSLTHYEFTRKIGKKNGQKLQINHKFLFGIKNCKYLLEL